MFERSIIVGNFIIKLSNISIKNKNTNILIIMVYVDDIVFRRNVDRMSQKIAKEMQKEFEMSMLGKFHSL